MKLPILVMLLGFSVPMQGQWKWGTYSPGNSVEVQCHERTALPDDPDDDEWTSPEVIEQKPVFDDYAPIPEKVRHAINVSSVGIKVETGGLAYHGTGFVLEINDKGIFVVTDLHVVADVGCVDGRWQYVLKDPKVSVYAMEDSYKAEIMNVSNDYDLALLKIDPAMRAKFMKTSVRVRQKLFTETSGPYYASSLYENSKVRSIILPKLEQYRDAAEIIEVHDVITYGLGTLKGLVRPGYSGGCIFDKEGYCGGISDAYTPSAEITYFIPIARAVELLKSTPGID